MLRNRGILPLLLAIMLALVSLPAHSEKLWDHVGRIDVINGAHQLITVNDLSLKITTSSRFYSATGVPISLSELRKGQLVGCDFEYRPGIGQTVTELRVYPDSAKPRTEDEVD